MYFVEADEPYPAFNEMPTLEDDVTFSPRTVQPMIAPENPLWATIPVNVATDL